MTRDQLIEAMRYEICRHQCQGEITEDCKVNPNCLCLQDAQAGLRAIENAGLWVCEDSASATSGAFRPAYSR
jgi:hypothetical protein